MSSMKFHAIKLPDGAQQFIPSDVSIAFPVDAPVEPHRLHLLTHIPWDRKFLKLVPQPYHALFNYVLPYLRARTTNVHTAISLSYVPELVAAIDPRADVNIATIAVIMHDCGWSQVTPAQIADSLDYTGVRFTPSAAEAKRLHTAYGKQLIPGLLAPFKKDFNLSTEDVSFIADISFYHERPLDYAPNTPPPSELLIACEADRIWPYTHQNFWLDVVRKGVEPAAYIQNVATSIEEQFFTKAGNRIAWRLIDERITEVALYESFIARRATKTSSSRTRFHPA